MLMDVRGSSYSIDDGFNGDVVFRNFCCNRHISELHFKPLLQPFNFDKKYKRTKIHVERSVVDNVVVSHYVPKLNERLVQYSSTIVPIFIVSALVDASLPMKDT